MAARAVSAPAGRLRGAPKSTSNPARHLGPGDAFARCERQRAAGRLPPSEKLHQISRARTEALPQAEGSLASTLRPCVHNPVSAARPCHSGCSAKSGSAASKRPAHAKPGSPAVEQRQRPATGNQTFGLRTPRQPFSRASFRSTPDTTGARFGARFASAAAIVRRLIAGATTSRAAWPDVVHPVASAAAHRQVWSGASRSQFWPIACVLAEQVVFDPGRARKRRRRCSRALDSATNRRSPSIAAVRRRYQAEGGGHRISRAGFPAQCGAERHRADEIGQQRRPVRTLGEAAHHGWPTIGRSQAMAGSPPRRSVRWPASRSASALTGPPPAPPLLPRVPRQQPGAPAPAWSSAAGRCRRRFRRASQLPQHFLGGGQRAAAWSSNWEHRRKQRTGLEGPKPSSCAAEKLEALVARPRGCGWRARQRLGGFAQRQPDQVHEPGVTSTPTAPQPPAPHRLEAHRRDAAAPRAAWARPMRDRGDALEQRDQRLRIASSVAVSAAMAFIE